MLIFRYLCKETITTMLAMMVIIILIFSSNQFVQYLERAAGGHLPGLVVLRLMALELPNLLSLLLPLGFYSALLFAYGRLYTDNEMIALSASGFSQAKLYKYTLIMATFVAVLVTYLVFWVNPDIYHTRAKLLRDKGVATLIKTISPKRFRALSGGKQVFYVNDISDDGQSASNIFFAEKDSKKHLSQWKVMWAKTGNVYIDERKNETHITLDNGHIYQGQPGEADFKIYKFKQIMAPLPKPVISVSDDVRTLSTTALLPFNNSNKELVAELQWRLSIPIMVYVLTFLALPLSKVNARQGKYAKLFPALLIYIIYANLMFFGRDWILEDQVPWWLGLWWIHLLMLLLAVILTKRQNVRR